MDPYVEDEDPDSLISWSIIPGDHVEGAITNRILHLYPLDTSWTGYDNITLRATDSEGLSSQRPMNCHVVNPEEWENHNPDGTVTLIWSTGSPATAVVRFGSNPYNFRTEARSLLNPSTQYQVRLLGMPPDQIVYYQVLNHDLTGSLVFESPVDSFVVSSVSPDDVFRVTMIDVRQGDSFLLVTPSNQIIVIDGGYGTYQPYWGGAWSGEGHPFALEYLQNQGINHVDHMVETHHDMDHWGGLRDIQNSMPVYHYYSPDSPGTMEVGQPWDLGDSLLEAMVLSVDYPPGVPTTGDNNRSIVIRFAIGQISFLFTGDAERDVELWEVATYGNDLQSTVLKVGHHGSSTSSDIAFLQKVQPEIALISCGADNPYGHPHDETLTSLNNIAAEIYRTDLDGDVTLRTDGVMTIEITR